MNPENNIFAEQGTCLEAGGNRPVLLDDARKVWIVKSGQVDIFSVQISGTEAVGTRRHVFRAKEGDALFGMDLGRKGSHIGLVAVGAVGTKLLEIERSRFVKLAGSPGHREIAVALISRWIKGLSSYLTRAEVQPRNVHKLEADSKISVDPGTNVYSPDKLVWVKPLQGSTLYLGRQDWPPVPQKHFFPLTKGAWLQCVEKSELSVIDSEQALEEDSIWAAMDAFHKQILEYITVNKRNSEQDERARLERKTTEDRFTLQGALYKLEFILERKKSKLFVKDRDGQPLLTACQAIGKATGIPIKLPKQEDSGNGKKESLVDISRMNRFRTRQVLLKDSWWSRDNGPLLAFTERKKLPVALLQTSARSYELYDPVKETRQAVTEEIADSLDSVAYAFYRPLPEKAVSGKDLLKMGLWGRSHDMAMIFLMGLTGALLGLLTPIVTGIVFDSIIPGAERNQLLQIAAILITCALATMLFDITRGIALARIEGKIDGVVQAGIWDRLLALPVPFFRKYTAGDLAQRSMGVMHIRMVLSGITITAVLGCFFSSANLALLFYYDWKLALVAIGLSLVGIIFSLVAGYMQVRHQRKIVQIEGENSGTVLQFITGINKLRISGTEDRAFAIWANKFATQKNLAFKAGTIQNVQSTFNSAFPVVASMSIFAWIIMKGEGGLSTGGFLAFNSAFQNALLQMTMALSSSLNIIPLFERLKPILNALPEADETKAHPPELSGEIEVCHVNFRYLEDGPLVLKDVSLNVSPGEFVAIVGESGSGKSTLFRMLLGFETPESGTIFYDRQDLNTLDIRELRRQMGVVLQHAIPMQGDLFRNIVGESNLTIDNAWEAARMVGLEEEIKEMPMGMHTVISFGGGTLSGGQRQRLIIARAIVKHPRILFFDEATSALDNQSQAVVSRSLEGLHVTRIVIAHRLSTIINADRIYVLDQGEIIQSGTHDELMSQKGFFAEMAKRQLA